jgi:hypothetical protein
MNCPQTYLVRPDWFIAIVMVETGEGVVAALI